MEGENMSKNGDLSQTFRKAEYAEKEKAKVEAERPKDLCPMVDHQPFQGSNGWVCKCGVYCGSSEMKDWQQCPMYIKYGRYEALKI